LAVAPTHREAVPGAIEVYDIAGNSLAGASTRAFFALVFDHSLRRNGPFCYA
jgi:hypothetical protein